MVDIHCHILHSIDDGAKDLAASLEMCRVAVQNGIDKIVATPHFLYFSKVEEFFEKRDTHIAELRNKIAALGLRLQIFPGAEVAASDAMLRCEYLNRLTINGTRYILLELPFTSTKEKKIYEYADYVFDCGLIPIIAHPERYEYTLKDYDIINNLADRGCLFQINIGSAIGQFGHRPSALSNAMIKNRLADFLSTDAHYPHDRRSPDMAQMLSKMKGSISDEDKQYMTTIAPELVLQGRPLYDRQAQYIKKKLFSL